MNSDVVIRFENDVKMCARCYMRASKIVNNPQENVDICRSVHSAEHP